MNKPADVVIHLLAGGALAFLLPPILTMIGVPLTPIGLGPFSSSYMWLLGLGVFWVIISAILYWKARDYFLVGIGGLGGSFLWPVIFVSAITAFEGFQEAAAVLNPVIPLH